MATVSLGNVAPIAKLTVPSTGQRVVVPQTQLKQSITIINIPPHIDFSEAVHLVTNGFWPSMSSEKPAWVACDDDPDLEAAVARTFDCPRGRPEGFEVETSGEAAPGLGVPMEAAEAALKSGAGYLEAPPTADDTPVAAPTASAAPAADEED